MYLDSKMSITGFCRPMSCFVRMLDNIRVLLWNNGMHIGYSNSALFS